MRTLNQAAAVVAVAGIALGVAACGSADDSSAPVKTATKVTASVSSTPTSTMPADHSHAPGAMTTDAALTRDLKNMATLQETYMLANPSKMGVEVPAITVDGASTKVGQETFRHSPGNVIAVKVDSRGYCISGYNPAATEATSATKTLVYNSDKGGIQAGVGTC